MKQAEKVDVERLQARRLELGLTLEQVCQGICSLSFLSMIESGKRSPSLKLLSALNERLGLVANKTDANELSIWLMKILAAFKIGDLDYVNRATDSLESKSEIAFVKGRLFEIASEWAKATHELLPLFESSDFNPKIRILSAISVVRCEIALSDFHRAVQLGEEALSKLEPYEAQHFDEYFELRAVVAGCYSEVGDMNRALALLQQNMAERPSSAWLRVMQLWAQSNAYENAGKLTEASALAAQAMVVAQEIDRPIARATILQNHAFLSLKSGNYDLDALISDLSEAEQILRKHDAKSNLANCLDTRALAEALSGDKTMAVELLNEVEVLRAESDKSVKARSKLSAAETYLILNETELARAHVVAARDLLSNIKAGRLEAQAWRTMAKVYETLGDTTSVVACLKAATDLLGLTVAEYVAR